MIHPLVPPLPAMLPRFARVHRSHIIAFPAVDHLRSGGYTVILDDGTDLRVSRSYAPDVQDRLV